MWLRSVFGKLKNDLGIKLLILYSLFVVPIVIATISFDQFSGNRLRRDVMADDLALARAIGEETNTTLDNTLLSIRTFSEYEVVIDGDLEGMLELFQHFLDARPDINLIYRLSDDGVMLAHYPEGPISTVGTNFSFRAYFIRAQTATEPLVSLGRVSPTTQEPVATAVMPLWAEGEFIGVAAANIKLQSLSTTLESIAKGYVEKDQFEVVIVDSVGDIVASPNSQDLLVNLSAFLPEVLESVLGGGEGNRIESNQEGIEMLYSYVPIPSVGWGVIVSQPTSVAFRTPDALHRGALWLIGVFSGIGIFFWGALYMNVLKPIETLAAYSSKFGFSNRKGGAEKKSLQAFINRYDQIGNLIRSFTWMEESLQARIDELNTLLETSRVVVSSLDPEIVLNRILEQVERLLGIKKSMIVALDETSGAFLPSVHRGLSPGYTEGLVLNPSESSSLTLQALKIGKPIIIQDVEMDPSFVQLRPRAKAEGYRAFAAIPLQTIHAPPTALVLYSPDANVFRENDIDLLLSFANQAAMALENAELYARSDAQLQKQTSRLEALIQSLEVGLVLENLYGEILYINRMIREFTNLPDGELLGNQVEKLYNSILENAEERETASELVKTVLQGEGEEEVTFSLRTKAGRRIFRLSGFTVRDSSGLLIGRGQFLRDMTREYELDRMKSGLISTVSHELQTPLASIKGFATTLLAEDVRWEQESQREFLEIISKEADRMSELVNNLLDVSRIEAGSLTLQKIYCSLEEIANKAIMHATPNPGSRMQLDISSDVPLVLIDPFRVEVVIRNLIENAVKYSDNDLPISLKAHRENGKVIVSVIDQGPGIPEENHHSIFTSFFRLEYGLARKTPGFGLGLSICRGFVHAHGGEIWVEPQEKGACIAFSLPVEG